MLFADDLAQAEMLLGSTEWFRNDSGNLLASKIDLEQVMFWEWRLFVSDDWKISVYWIKDEPGSSGTAAGVIRTMLSWIFSMKINSVMLLLCNSNVLSCHMKRNLFICLCRRSIDYPQKKKFSAVLAFQVTMWLCTRAFPSARPDGLRDT